MVSPGGGGNPQQRQPWQGSDPEGHQRVSVPQHGVVGTEPTEGGEDTAVTADPVVEALQGAGWAAGQGCLQEDFSPSLVWWWCRKSSSQAPGPAWRLCLGGALLHVPWLILWQGPRVI